MFELNPKIADALPSVRTTSKPYKWEVFEVTAKDGRKYVVSIGSYESDPGAGGPTAIDVLVANNHSHPRNPRPAMIGGGSKELARVKVTPGGVYLDVPHLKFHGIGSIVFNIVVAWAKRTFPSIGVVPIRIVRQDPKSESPKEFEARRDALIKFYGRFGFTWPTPLIEDEGGGFSSQDMTEEDLRVYPEARLTRIRRLDLPSALDVLFDDANALIDAQAELEAGSKKLAHTRALLTSRRDPWNVVGRRLNFIMLPILFVCGVAIGRWIG